MRAWHIHGDLAIADQQSPLTVERDVVGPSAELAPRDLVDAKALGNLEAILEERGLTGEGWRQAEKEREQSTR